MTEIFIITKHKDFNVIEEEEELIFGKINVHYA